MTVLDVYGPVYGPVYGSTSAPVPSPYVLRTSYWPAVSERLAVIFNTLAPAGVAVFDGKRLNHNGGRDYVCVGWDQDDDAGSVAFERSDLGNDLLAETGTIICLLVAQGGADLKAARGRAFNLAQALAAAVSADQTLTVLPPSSTCTVTAQVEASVGDKGVAQVLTLQVTYTTPF